MIKKIVRSSLLLLAMTLILIGVVSAVPSNPVLESEVPYQTIVKDTPIKANSEWVSLINFSLSTETANMSLDKLEFRFMSKGTPALGTGDIIAVGIFDENGNEISNFTSPYGINYDSATTTIWGIGHLLSTSEPNNFTFKMRTGSDKEWSENKAIGVQITKYNFGLAGDGNFQLAASPTSANFKWYADTVSPTISLTYNKTGTFTEGDVVNITATSSENLTEAPSLLINQSTNVIKNESMNKNTNKVWYYEFTVPATINGEVNVTASGTDPAGNMFSFTNFSAFTIDNTLPTISTPWALQYNDTGIVTFNFTADDNLDEKLDYIFYLDGVANKTGVANAGVPVEFELPLTDGLHNWSVKATDNAGLVGNTQIFKFVVDTVDPVIESLSPENLSVNTTGSIIFAFTANDTPSYDLELPLGYVFYLDGVQKNTSNSVGAGNKVQIPIKNLSAGVHNWSVKITDAAGNNNSSESRNFYVDLSDLAVTLNYPASATDYVSTDAKFNFSVGTGAGLPFNYRLLINGKEKANGTFIAGEPFYNVNASVADGEGQNWTVNITTIGSRTIQPAAVNFSVDTVDPAPVSGMTVTDALDPEIYDYHMFYSSAYLSVYVDEGGDLNVSWDASKESDFDHYGVYINTSTPANLSELKPEFESSDKEMNFTVLRHLVNGQPYYVAVVAFDHAGNYNKSIKWVSAIPYEDTNLTLEKGWNLVSVPQRLLDSSKLAAFGQMPVLYWNGTEWEAAPEIVPAKGYWVYSKEVAEVNLKYKPMTATNPDLPPALELEPGWQMIGPTSRGEQDYEDELLALGGELYEDWDYGEPKYSNLLTYTPLEGWGSVLDYEFGSEFIPNPDSIGPTAVLISSGYTVPGKGYWVFITKPAVYSGSMMKPYKYFDSHDPKK